MDKAAYRLKIEDFLKNSNLDDKSKIIKSLKGYSKVTKKIEKYLKDIKNEDYLLIGKLLIEKKLKKILNLWKITLTKNTFLFIQILI